MKYKFSEDIQRGIIYLSKTNKEFLLTTLSLVEIEYFDTLTLQRIYGTVKDYFSKYNKLPKDEYIIEDLRKSIGPKDDLDDYEIELEEINCFDTSSVKDHQYYSNLVEGFAQTCAYVKALSKATKLLEEGKVDSIDRIIRDAGSITRNTDLGIDYFKDPEKRLKGIFSKEAQQECYKTILPTLNKSFENQIGLGKKELAMVVASSGKGKSLFLVNQAVHLMKQGLKGVYITFEMSEDKVARRLNSVISMIPQLELRLKIDDFATRMVKFKEKFPGADLRIKEYPDKGATIYNIRSYLDSLELHQEYKPDFIMIDYLELIQAEKGLVEYMAQQSTCTELRALAKENNILIWTATQTNRQGASVTIITELELGDSYGKIRPCDLAISLNQTQEEYQNGSMRCFVIKNRNGVSRTLINMKVDYNTLIMKEAIPVKVAKTVGKGDEETLVSVVARISELADGKRKAFKAN